MWKNNKYAKWYYSIVKNAELRIYSAEEYVERHHIIPKSLGGSNDKENIVKLRAREHFICHLLLVRMCATIENTMKMKKAAHFFIANHKYNNLKINCNTYGLLKKQFSEAMRFRKQTQEEIEKRRKSCTSRRRTEEQKKRMSEAQQEYLKASFNSEEASLRVKIGMANMTEETRLAMKKKQSLVKLGKPGPIRGNDVYQKIAEKNRGRKNTEEAKDRMSLSKLEKFGIKEPKFKDVIVWEILRPDNLIIEITNLNQWAKDNNLSPKVLYSTENKDRTCNGFKIQGRKIVQVQTIHSRLSLRQERLLTGVV